MSGWTPIFGKILESSVWCGETSTKEVKILWITMLAKKNRHGIVESSLPGLAKLAGLTIPETLDALDVLMAPDPWSRRPVEHEGRRIEEVSGGWRILSHEKYQKEMEDEARRARQRKYLEAKRSRLKGSAPMKLKLGKTLPEIQAEVDENKPENWLPPEDEILDSISPQHDPKKQIMQAICGGQSTSTKG